MIKVLLNNHSVKKVLKNASYTTLIQAGNYLFPLLATSYLVRTIGADLFGRIAYFQNIVLYLFVVVIFGYDFSVSKEVSLHRGHKKSLVEIFWASIYLRLALIFVSCAIGCLIIFFWQKIRSDWLLFLYALLAVPGQGLFTNWYYQGLERMAIVALFNFITRAVPFAMIFFMVKNPQDYRYYPLLTSISFLTVGLVSFYFSWKELGFEIISVWKLEARLKSIFSKSAPIFISTTVQSLLSLGNFVIVGWSVNDSELGSFSIAQRSVFALLSLTQLPLNLALYPYFVKAIEQSRERAIIVFQKIFTYTLITSAFLAGLIFLLAPLICSIIIGNHDQVAVNSLRILAFLPVFWGVTCTTTYQGIYAFGYQRYSPLISSVSALISISTTFALAKNFGVYAACYGWVVGQFIEVAQGILFLNHKGIKIAIKT